MRFYKHKDPNTTFDAPSHKWLVEAAPGKFFFVLKESDRPTAPPNLDTFDLVPAGEVPLHVRRLAASRWGGFCRQENVERMARVDVNKHGFGVNEYGQNLHKPAEHVLHANLRRASFESPFRSVCPVCERGLLLVARHPETFDLVDRDRCVRCGQLFIYEDAMIGGEPVLKMKAGETL